MHWHGLHRLAEQVEFSVSNHELGLQAAEVPEMDARNKGGSMSEEKGFLVGLRERPIDDSLRLIYADWLEEHGDARRAEYLRLECQFGHILARLAELRTELSTDWLAAVQRCPARATLKVVRGSWPDIVYPIFEGANFVGRADEQPVDVDLSIQEPPDRVWCSLQHALITCGEGGLDIEDLNTANGTYVNRTRVPPGERRALRAGDIIQIGQVQLKVVQ